jgi:ElaB/YqjD/DUF883 family membrane-anchored ribosome-binding protein
MKIDAISDTLNSATAAAMDIRRTTEAKFDDARRETAASLHAAASAIKTAGETTSQTVDDLASTAANKLESASRYIRKHDADGMVSDIHSVIRRNPGTSVLVAAGVGLFAGLALRRR